MSEIQEIDVRIGPDGTVKLEVRGAKGGNCLKLTEDLEKLLGSEITERVHTDEFHEEEDTLVQQRELNQGLGEET